MFNFRDDKSRKQINHAIVHANDTKQANAEGQLQYAIKKARLVGSRNEWELEDQPS